MKRYSNIPLSTDTQMQEVLDAYEEFEGEASTLVDDNTEEIIDAE